MSPLTEEQRRFESRSTQLGIPIHTAYVALKLAYTNSGYHDLSTPEPVLRHPRTQYSSPLQARRPRGYALLSPSLHSQCVVVGSSSRATGVRAFHSMWLVAKSRSQQAYNEWFLILFRRRHCIGTLTQIQLSQRFSNPFPADGQALGL